MSVCQVCTAPDDLNLCRPCLDEIERAVGDMQALLHQVSLLATGQTRTYRTSTRVPYSDEELAELDEEYRHRMARIPARLRSRDGRMALPSTPTVVNLDARELLADAYDTLAAQVIDLRDLAKTEPAGWSDVVPWLLRNLDVIRAHPGAGSIHDELTFIHDRIERAVDRSPERVYAGPCQAPLLDDDGVKVGRCESDLYATVRLFDAAWVERKVEAGEQIVIVCRGSGLLDDAGCGTGHTIGDRRDWLIEEIQTHTWPLQDLWRVARSLLGVEVGWETVRRWPRRQNGVPPRLHAVNPHAELLLYRGSDVFNLIRDEGTRRGRKRAS